MGTGLGGPEALTVQTLNVCYVRLVICLSAGSGGAKSSVLLIRFRGFQTFLAFIQLNMFYIAIHIYN